MKMLDKMVRAMAAVDSGIAINSPNLDQYIGGIASDYKAMAVAVLEVLKEPSEEILNKEGIHSNCHMCGGHKEGLQNIIAAILDEAK